MIRADFVIRGDFDIRKLDSVTPVSGEKRMQKGDLNDGGRPIKTSLVRSPLLKSTEKDKIDAVSLWSTVDFQRLGALCVCLKDCKAEFRIQLAVKIYDGIVPPVCFPAGLVKEFAELDASIDVDIYTYPEEVIR